jgi:hypothetical protein
MSMVDSAIVLLPRFTTLVGASSFTTLPVDVSKYGSAQFQLWRGPLRGTPAAFLAYLEESLDAEHWVLGPSTPTGYDPATDDPTLTRPKLFSYGFRLRWFRIRIELSGTAPGCTCWAEGLLRDGGGGGGAWVSPSVQASGAATVAPIAATAGNVSIGGLPVGAVARSSAPVRQAYPMLIKAPQFPFGK